MDIKNKIEAYLQRGLNAVGKHPSAIFVEFWSEHYGQEVDVLLTDIKGHEWHVDRVLHLEGRDEITDQTVSWRTGGLEQLDYSVEYFESMFPNWEDHDEIFPFAGINTKHANEYDLVTLDYTESIEPRISVWLHEKSLGREDPFLVMVSRDIQEFIQKWRST